MIFGKLSIHKVGLFFFGFSNKFCSWISNILSSTTTSILFNGTFNGYFACFRGSQQGDPFFQILFRIAEDFLSWLLLAKVTSGEIHPMMTTRSMLAPTHFLHAYAILLFCRGTKVNIKKVVDCFKIYRMSNQLVSWEKSYIYFGNGIVAGMRYRLVQDVGVQKFTFCVFRCSFISRKA